MTSGRNARHAMGENGAAIESRRVFRRNNETDSRRPGAVRLSGPRDESGRPGGVRPPASRRPRAAGSRADVPHRVVHGRAGVRHGEGDDRRNRDDHVPGSPGAALDALSRRGGLAVTKVEREGRPQKFSTDATDFKLDVALDPPVADGESATVAISYSVKPRTGMFFLPEERKAPAAGVELRRGRAPQRLASDLQRHERPLRDRVRRDGPEGPHRGRERRLGRDSTTTRTARARFTGSRRARSPTT